MDRSLPAWLDVGVLPLLSLLTALLISGLIVLMIGINPLAMAAAMIDGALISPKGLGFSLFYATNYIFTGLAVSVAFRAAMFNIGGEGQALIASAGVAIAALALDSTNWVVSWPAAIFMSMSFGAFWALIPALLLAKRGSHVVITTIMMNFVAAALASWLVIYVFRDNIAGANESRAFLEGAHIPRISDILAAFGITYPKSVPLNLSFILALLASALVWFLIWRSRFGYELRAYGYSQSAARYGGISGVKIIIIALLISGALAGLMANNVVMGDQRKLGLDPIGGAGFIGIAVALMGRNHPLGIVFASLLFGALVQGGAELAFVFQGVSSDIVIVIQGLVILFVGALDNMFRQPLEYIWMRLVARSGAG